MLFLLLILLFLLLMKRKKKLLLRFTVTEAFDFRVSISYFLDYAYFSSIMFWLWIINLCLIIGAVTVNELCSTLSSIISIITFLRLNIIAIVYVSFEICWPYPFILYSYTMVIRIKVQASVVMFVIWQEVLDLPNNNP